MSDIAHSLYIKYGLSDYPSEYQIQQWATKTQYNISIGNDLEKAGALAAKETFLDFNTCFRKSQADSLLALLAKVKGK